MIKMIDIRPIFALLKFAKAIIASVVLGFQFALNLLHSQRSLNTSQTSTPSLCVGTYLVKVQGTIPLVGLPLSLVDFFPVGIARICCPDQLLFPMLSIILQIFFTHTCTIFPVVLSFPCVNFFPMGFTVLSMLCTYLFPMFLIALSFLLTDFHFVGFAVFLLFGANFFPMFLIAYFAIFDMGIIIGLQRSIPALFTASMQSTFTFMEELKGGRKRLLASIALLLWGIILGYTVHTSELTFHSSRPGVYQHRSDSTLLPLHYTINPLLEQVYGFLLP